MDGYDEIMFRSKRLKERIISGVYFLIFKDEIVYIGSSYDILNRIKHHCKDVKKVFNRYSYIEYGNLKQMESDELEYILNFKPRYNKKHNPDVFYSTQCKKARALNSRTL